MAQATMPSASRHLGSRCVFYSVVRECTGSEPAWVSPRAETAPYRKALGLVIRERREELELTQEEVGYWAKVDRTYMSTLESGQRNPTLETLIRLAEALDTVPSEILAAAESRKGRRRQ